MIARVIGALALGACVLSLGCDDAATTSDADVVSLSDTIPRLDTGFDQDATVPDTIAPPLDSIAGDDTTPGEDTFVPTDDTSVAQDTFVPADTVVAQDTFVPPADTVVAQDTFVPEDTVAPQDTTPADTGPGPDPVDNGLNAGWIGGACDGAGDCDHAGFSDSAMCQTGDFPNGFCTQACKQSTTSGAWICPDVDTSATTAFTTTRCISANGSPRCAAECDFGKSDGGCRPGYACVLRSRHGQPDKVFPVCLPADEGRWPGEPELADDIGKACDSPGDCANRSCLGLPGGYCSKAYCDVTGCPGASTCWGFSGGDAACLQDCGESAECRTSENYECDGDGTCWPSDDAPEWNPDVGAGDCATAWGNAGSGLSACDTQKDDYVVLHKSVRNMALCNKGNLVANYRMGLGFAPIGDKQIEGDGKTPEGVFYTPLLLPDSDYHRAFLVSYPDKTDSARGLAGGIITQAQKNAIDAAQTSCDTPPQSTGLGGWVEIHGEGGESDWTLGCAALDNDAVDVLWGILGVRDTIVILP